MLCRWTFEDDVNDGDEDDDYSDIVEDDDDYNIGPVDSPNHGHKLNQAPFTVEHPPYDDHDYSVQEEAESIRYAAALKEIERLKLENTALHNERCFYSRLSNDPEKVSFYTGFCDYKTLMSFFQTIEPTAFTMIRYAQYQRQAKKTRIGFPPKDTIPLVDQYLLVLKKLRVGSLHQELADEFHISVATAGRIWISWVNYLYFVFSTVELWPSQAQVREHLPDVFKEQYPRTRVILDCTELWLQKPSSLYLNSELYSHYKGTNTMKGLIGIIPSGAVSFVSKLYAGSISDTAITKASGIMQLLQPGDEVMVDKGFLIEGMLESVGAKLVIPAFLTASRSQFDEEEVKETQTIARLRVHVERAIRRVKSFHIFDRVVPMTMLGELDQIWCVCCLLTNFRGELF